MRRNEREAIQYALDELKQWNPESEAVKQIEEVLQWNDNFFHITSVHRDDLEHLGFDSSEITDEQMERLAEKMANDYCTQLFDDSLEILAEDYFNFPKHD